MAGRPVSWIYGVTTVPERKDTLLPQTLTSLKAAGFDKPILFIDGIDHEQAASMEQQFQLPIVSRGVRLRTFGNWILALWELYIRQPICCRYAIFQDDIILSANTKAYLDKLRFPDKGYLNLHTFPQNETGQSGLYLSKQNGLSATALVFSREAVQAILCNRNYIVARPTNLNAGHRNIDGGIISTMKESDFREWVHSPSLVQHVGDRSVMGNQPYPKAVSFRGESFDALSLLNS